MTLFGSLLRDADVPEERSETSSIKRKFDRLVDVKIRVRIITAACNINDHVQGELSRRVLKNYILALTNWDCCVNCMW